MSYYFHARQLHLVLIIKAIAYNFIYLVFFFVNLWDGSFVSKKEKSLGSYTRISCHVANDYGCVPAVFLCLLILCTCL